MATGMEILGSTKVQRRLKSFQAPMMNVPVANLRTDFDPMVNYVHSLISTIDHKTHNVSQVETKLSCGKKFGKVHPRASNAKSRKKARERNYTNDKSLYQ
jgi:hypothetical protein